MMIEMAIVLINLSNGNNYELIQKGCGATYDNKDHLYIFLEKFDSCHVHVP